MESINGLLGVGAGMAALGFPGAAVGISLIFVKMIESVARQPAAEPKLTKYVWIGFALVETVALYGFVIAMVIIFALKQG